MNFQTASTEQLQAQGYKVKTLKTRGPRKGETLSRNSQLNRGGAVGSIDSNDSTGGVSSAVGGGKGQTITRVTGMGREMVSDLGKVQRKYRAQAKADRRAFVLGY